MATKAAGLLTKTTAAKTADDAYENAKAALKNLREARDAAVYDLRLEHTAVAAAVEAEAKGDPVMLTSSGYELAAARAASNSPPDKVENLSVSAGDDDGSVDVNWDPEELTKTYEVQTAASAAGPWTTTVQTTAATAKVAGLTKWLPDLGARARHRLEGAGPWSDVATKMVP